MRSAIKEYIEYTEAEKKELWDNATFAFDTNVFLDLYRYSNKTRKNLLEAIEKLKPRIWMPYQVAYEFCKDRYGVIEESNKRYEDIKDDVDQFIQKWKQKLRLEEPDSDIKKLKEDILKWIKEKKEKSFIVFDVFNDSVFNKILELFNGATGEEYSAEDRAAIEKEGEERFSHKIPPGYKDKGKTENQYGDLLVWKELIKYSKNKSVDIIFVTNDQKEDWWNTCSGKTIGPRVELRKEFYKETRRKFHMYTMTSFLSFVNDNKKDTIDKETIKEVETISQKYKTEIPIVDKEPFLASKMASYIVNNDGTFSYNPNNRIFSSATPYKYENGQYSIIPNTVITSDKISIPDYVSTAYVSRPESYITAVPKDSIMEKLVIGNFKAPVLSTESDFNARVANLLGKDTLEKKDE